MRFLSVVALLQLPLVLAADTVKNLVVFGDSNADVGNFQRWTNGPVWSEDLAVGWNATLHSFAYTGATCDRARFSSVMRYDDSPSIKDQVEMYYHQSLNHDPAETVYAILVGASDIHKSFLQRVNSTSIPDLKPVVECIGQQRNIRKMYGANRFLVFNVLPMEHMPFYKDSSLAASRGEAAKEFNRLLAKEVTKMNKYHHALALDLIDVHSLLSDLMANPTDFGFKDASSAYLGQCRERCDGRDVDKYVWWDRTHLTGGAHHMIANSILLAGSFAPSTSIDAQKTIDALALPNSPHRSPIYKSPPNTGIMDRLAAEAEQSSKKGATEPPEQTLDDETVEPNNIANYVVIGGFVCAVLVYWTRRQKKITGRWPNPFQHISSRLRSTTFTPVRSTDNVMA
ncbi:carbohydrate esterase family 16 protein [Phycomyces blakesleeanus NRRL 1555(-)]|uniref:Carbohydrate esterase family 16 protein n=1 Tax=Phycomyces blakesleeanus (strain ATCC 8743b / DSM 1359 / FGSC 10004 / NBRC 33097 / NRRL 1555) TaxID=763407 RepID=A0A162XVF3_PHYB8|nr:carbohydrate esterase family 16 protein [Phycomyces blakesleeanus NRRL 1555(-)]OAD76695.1 carbohydrate esterase family 16 protein [Phycomyces blakesleeanus NRRL 1555(-)]|eukprot:XP_018294735.1 carbohydrate esterase family 16 protein [Phycomyces blakesleeanus NRRL 1555(-)]